MEKALVIIGFSIKMEAGLITTVKLFKNNLMKTNIIYQKSTKTFRLMPFNYWLASSKNNSLVFDSWDGMTKEHFKKNRFLKLKIFLKFIVLKINKKL